MKKVYILLYGVIYFVSAGFILCCVDIFSLRTLTYVNIHSYGCFWCGDNGTAVNKFTIYFNGMVVFEGKIMTDYRLSVAAGCWDVITWGSFLIITKGCFV